MGFRSLRACADALRAEGHLVEVDHPVDPHLQIAEIQRRLFRAGGPAVLFTHPAGSAFPILANLYGTRRRSSGKILASRRERVDWAFSPLPPGEGRG